MAKKPRIMLYSHDTFGLDHLRRSLAIAERLAAAVPGSQQLLITGSMVAGAFGLPPRFDMIKLPALSKRSGGEYKARTLPLTLKQTLDWREQIILQAAVHFKPDLLLVDKVAAGVQGELLPTLRHLRAFSRGTKMVLGMRDIEDAPAATRADWEALGTEALLESLYDRILLYGERTVFDPIATYGLSPAIAGKVIECGYLRRDQVARPVDTVRRELGVDGGRLIVVTAGGGGDGFELIKGALAAAAGPLANGAIQFLLVTGPLMAERKRKILRRAAEEQPVTLMEFTPDLISYLNAADLVVSMAGYNTVCEILSLGKRAVLVPRRQGRAEQRLRAGALAARGLVRCLDPEVFTPETLAAEIKAGLSGPEPNVRLNLHGLSRTAAAIADLLPAKQKWKRTGAGRQASEPAVEQPLLEPMEVSP